MDIGETEETRKVHIIEPVKNPVPEKAPVKVPPKQPSQPEKVPA